MQSSRSAFIWNMLGSLANAASSMLLMMFVGRAQGDGAAGIFSISLAVSQLFATIGLFEIRTYQSSDLKEEFKFKEYFSFKIFSCLAMMIFSFFYIILKGYQGLELRIILLMCIYKCLDALIDVFHGLFQQKNRLEIAGKSLFIRTVLCTVAFVILVYKFDDLFIPILVMNIITILWMGCYDFYHTFMLEKTWVSIDLKKIFFLFKECLPLCICSFISIYLINSPKYAIDSYANYQTQGIFGYIFMPTSVINLFSIFILRPLIGDLSTAWNTGNMGRFVRLVLMVVGWIGVLTIVTLIGGYFLGIPVLSLFYATNLNEYRYHLIIILLGGGFSALTTAFYYILTVMRRQKSVLLTYMIVFPFTLILVPLCTKYYGLIGASYGYLFSMIVLSIGLCITLIISIRYINNIN
ncbi:MAG: lipopolysaccharide biosynthesis protein [Beduini sp.]|uniref:lipopolysaccharide biosynthesis protein n=1 Tax=Beduini sp. TaxID=1922300 RepID=UPI0039906446